MLVMGGEPPPAPGETLRWADIETPDARETLRWADVIIARDAMTGTDVIAFGDEVLKQITDTGRGQMVKFVTVNLDQRGDEPKRLARIIAECKKGEEIDLRVRSLVTALNRIRGVGTFSSCGGHAEPQPGQAGADSFYVCFVVERTSHGEIGIARIRRAVSATDPKRISVTAEPDEDGTETMAFQIAGRDGADPGALAQALHLP